MTETGGDDLEDQIDVLVAEIQGIDAQLAHRKAAIQAYQQECFAAGQIGKERWFAAKTDYDRWRAKAIGAKGHMIAELRELKAKLRDTNVLTSKDEHGHYQAFWRLHRAIGEHRQKVMDGGYAATKADMDLWAALDEPPPK